MLIQRIVLWFLAQIRVFNLKNRPNLDVLKLAFRLAFAIIQIKMIDASNLFNALIALVAGTFAFIVYLVQRSNYRRDAANVILGEIRQAQSQLSAVQEHVARFRNENDLNVEMGLIPGQIKFMPVESWSKYKALFTRRMDQPTFDVVSKFYDHAKSYDAAVEYDNGSFAKNEDSIRTNVSRMTMDMTIKAYEANLISDPDADNYEDELTKLFKSVNNIDTIFRKNSSLAYNSRKPIRDAQAELSILSDMDMSLAILRLKKITSSQP